MTGLWLMELLPRRPRRRTVSLPPQQALHPPQPQFPLRPPLPLLLPAHRVLLHPPRPQARREEGEWFRSSPSKLRLAPSSPVSQAASYLLVRRGSVRGGRAVQELPAAL